MRGEAPTSLAGRVLTAPSRAIMTIDEFFKHIFYRQELTARAVEVAANAARLEGKNADEVFSRVLKETLETPPDDLVLMQSRTLVTTHSRRTWTAGSQMT